MAANNLAQASSASGAVGTAGLGAAVYQDGADGQDGDVYIAISWVGDIAFVFSDPNIPNTIFNEQFIYISFNEYSTRTNSTETYHRLNKSLLVKFIKK